MCSQYVHILYSIWSTYLDYTTLPTHHSDWKNSNVIDGKITLDVTSQRGHTNSFRSVENIFRQHVKYLLVVFMLTNRRSVLQLTRYVLKIVFLVHCSAID